jgi:hypothetical protein
MENSSDIRYLQILLNRLEVCKMYKPKFGQGGDGLSLNQFQDLYGADPFYSWFGLDNSLVYAAHRAAGGITSVYRQIGIGSEELFRQIIQDHLNLTTEQVNWAYQITASSGRSRTLKLDGRIEPTHISNPSQRTALQVWMKEASQQLGLENQVAQAMRGMVMEIRQGYKSKDSKRQNADMANAAEAYTQGYLPTLIVLSTQIDSDIVERFQRGKWLVLRGTLSGDPLSSTYSFIRDIIGYDLAAFFQRNAEQLKQFTTTVFESLLGTHHED